MLELHRLVDLPARPANAQAFIVITHFLAEEKLAGFRLSPFSKST
jgi:hypothetical protein